MNALVKSIGINNSTNFKLAHNNTSSESFLAYWTAFLLLYSFYFEETERHLQKFQTLIPCTFSFNDITLEGILFYFFFIPIQFQVNLPSKLNTPSCFQASKIGLFTRRSRESERYPFGTQIDSIFSPSFARKF